MAPSVKFLSTTLSVDDVAHKRAHMDCEIRQIYNEILWHGNLAVWKIIKHDKIGKNRLGFVHLNSWLWCSIDNLNSWFLNLGILHFCDCGTLLPIWIIEFKRQFEDHLRFILNSKVYLKVQKNIIMKQNQKQRLQVPSWVFVVGLTITVVRIQVFLEGVTLFTKKNIEDWRRVVLCIIVDGYSHVSLILLISFPRFHYA